MEQLVASTPTTILLTLGLLVALREPALPVDLTLHIPGKHATQLAQAQEPVKILSYNCEKSICQQNCWHMLSVGDKNVYSPSALEQVRL